MGKRILVLGGYGTFGRRISRAIAAMPSVECVIGGRRPRKGRGYNGDNITALADMLAPEFDRISDIHVCLSPGNKNPCGKATLRTILSYAGSSFRIKENGRWRNAYGWSESEKVVFPAPVGKRRVYLCDVPDLDIFPTRYGAQTVIFRAGLGLKLFNRGLFLLARARRLGWIKNLTGWAPGLIVASHLFRGFGSAAGGMQVLVRGRKNGEEIQHTASLVARDNNGLMISCSPALA